MTNQVTDHGMLSRTMGVIREETSDVILEMVADKGYENAEDIIKYLDNGIIAHLILDGGKDGYELEIPYEEAEADTVSTTPEELKKSFYARKIPEAYEDSAMPIKMPVNTGTSATKVKANGKRLIFESQS